MTRRQLDLFTSLAFIAYIVFSCAMCSHMLGTP